MSGRNEGSFSRGLRRFMPRGIKTFLKDQYLHRKYPTLHFGKDCNIKEAIFGKHVQLADKVTVFHSRIGDFSYLEVGCVAAHAHIGKFCSIAGSTFIGLGVHPSRDFVSTHPIFYSTGRGLHMAYADRDYLEEYAPVNVGNDVWIGTAAVVKGGITLGDGAIIGAGAVVTRDVPPYCIVGGVPAKPIRYRFDPQTIDFLMKFRWWDKDEAWLRANYKHFHNYRDFVNTFRQDGKPESKQSPPPGDPPNDQP